jgi:hypothetical protein
MDKTHQKLESGTVTFCYPVPRTLQTLTIKGLHKNLNTLVSLETMYTQDVSTVTCKSCLKSLEKVKPIKIHLAHNGWAACGNVSLEATYTQDISVVNCKSCLKSRVGKTALQEFSADR